MKFTELINSIKPLFNSETGDLRFVPEPDKDLDIQSIHYDSRSVKPGGLFVAIKGLVSDGHHFIEDAIKRGASAIVAEKMILSDTAIHIQVTDSRKALALISAAYFGKPSEKMHITGITGTNGKTTITYLLENIFRYAGFKTGIIGTVNYRYAGKEYPNPMTTPESYDLQKILSDMHKAGVTHVVMEASSHAIDLDRIYACSFDTAVFTNLTQDHLDYHQTMGAYGECKKRFFTDFLPATSIKKSSAAVINCNDEKGREIAGELNYPVLTTGSDDSNIRADHIEIDIKGIRGTIETPVGSISINSKAIGSHNLENILNAVGAALLAAVPLDFVEKGITHFDVPGRLERIENTRGLNVFVDYAHTPDALENVLTSVRSLTPGKLISVFGCGGDRDNSKRPKMGRIATLHSDLAVITSDNPRTENPDLIIGQIIKGLNATMPCLTAEDSSKSMSTKGYIVEPDRKKAIKRSIMAARKGDSVLIAGKGHETYQITNTGTIDFDDRLEARKALETDGK